MDLVEKLNRFKEFMAKRPSDEVLKELPDGFHEQINASIADVIPAIQKICGPDTSPKTRDKILMTYIMIFQNLVSDKNDVLNNATRMIKDLVPIEDIIKKFADGVVGMIVEDEKCDDPKCQACHGDKAGQHLH